MVVWSVTDASVSRERPVGRRGRSLRYWWAFVAADRPSSPRAYSEDPMRTIAEHRDEIAAFLRPVLDAVAGHAERLTLAELAAGAGAGHGFRVLAEPVRSPLDLPRFDNSQMDGYAVRSSEAGDPVAVVDPIPAGIVPPPLDPGTAAPIMTGSRIPAGADAVVPVEEIPPGSFPAGLALETLTVPDTVPGTFVRRTGSDLAAGAELAPAGTALVPAVLGALAAAGVETVAVVPRPRVLVVSTGSELAPDGDVGATIGDANGIALVAAFTEVGAQARAIAVPDDPEALLDALRGAVERDAPDLVVTTGGISMGAYEVVREALEPRGLTVTTVAMQPGGPQAWGTIDLGGSTLPVVAFPGNPVSALVSFEVFLRPEFARAAWMPADREELVLPAAEAAPSPARKHQVRRGTVVDGRVRFVGGASSHLLAHYATATHLVHVPVGIDRVEAGDPLTVWRIR
jgi:molybdopterin molybdotransferase